MTSVDHEGIYSLRFRNYIKPNAREASRADAEERKQGSLCLELVGGACSGLWKLTNRRRLCFSGGGPKRNAKRHYFRQRVRRGAVAIDSMSKTMCFFNHLSMYTFSISRLNYQYVGSVQHGPIVMNIAASWSHSQVFRC